MFASVGRMTKKSHQLCVTLLWVLTTVIWLPALCYGSKFWYTESDAAKFLDKINREAANRTNQLLLINWNCSTNFTNANAVKMKEISDELDKYLKEIHKEVIKYPWATFKNPDIRRQLNAFSKLLIRDLPKEDQKRFNRVILTMQTLFYNIEIPAYGNIKSNRSLYSDPGLTKVFDNNFDHKELQHVWTSWNKATGDKIKNLYPVYVNLSNQRATLNNYNDTADLWTRKYEIHNFRGLIEQLWLEIKPLYLQLHAYMRRKLWLKYGDSVLSRRGSIPVHLMGDMWSQSWERFANFSLPYPGEEDIDPTPALKSQNYTSKLMFEKADEFMKSLNLSAMPVSFWENSVFENSNRSLNNYLSNTVVWDFYDSKNYRIKKYSNINFKDFVDAYKQMGAIQYSFQYKHQPFIYRDGAVEGLLETVGNVFAMSASSPKYLRKIGLIKNPTRSAEAGINFLYKLGLSKIAYLPFQYIIDLWRWNVFEGITPEHNYNCDWWELRYNYQGFEPPVFRSEYEFDPGSIYSIIANVPFIKHFVNYVLQFQIHQTLCEKAGQFESINPKKKLLHECDISQSTKAGNALKKMMELGKSKPWLEALELVTGQRELSARPLMNYFRPLQEWLVNENRMTKELIGWETCKSKCIRVSVPWSGGPTVSRRQKIPKKKKRVQP